MNRQTKQVDELSVALFFLTALLLGMRHALDPDHLVAVSTLLAEERRFRPAAHLGLIWGLGHLAPLVLLGVPVLLLQLQLPAAMEQLADLGVGVVLVVLGARLLWRVHRERVHLHAHTHDGAPHTHFHSHAGAVSIQATTRAHSHRHAQPMPGSSRRRGWLTFATGLVHGLAGSGPAAALALTAARSPVDGLGYLLVFGAGTCAGMFLMTLCVAAPALISLSRHADLYRTVRVGAGLASVGLGLFLAHELVPQLFA